MRHEPTATEWRSWQALRCNQLGVAFRRQVVLQGYIADFYASPSGLIVEVDGSWHGQRKVKDARRDRVLAAACSTSPPPKCRVPLKQGTTARYDSTRTTFG